MKLSAIKTDDKRRQAGDWVKDIPEVGDLQLKVRGIGNTDYRILQGKLNGGVPFQERRAGLKPETQDRISIELAVETLLVDWRNLADEHDEPIVFSKEKARELLSDPDFMALRDAVYYAATVVADQQDEAKRADDQD